MRKKEKQKLLSFTCYDLYKVMDQQEWGPFALYTHTYM